MGVYYTMKTIPLTQGMIALVPNKEHRFLRKFTWYAYQRGGVWYAARKAVLGDKFKSRVRLRNVVIVNATCG